MYSPKIKEDLIRKLYQMSKETEKPMTELVNEMVRAGLRRWYQEKKTKKNKNQSINEL